MSRVIKIKKGLDIPLLGEAEKTIKTIKQAGKFAIKPPDFEGLTPKLTVKTDHEVKVGTTLFYDKYRPDIKFSSPVSGKVTAVNRGERRRILEVVIKPDEQQVFEEFTKANPKDLSKDDIIDQLLNSGLWTFIRQRPYAIIANPKDTPKSIFITGFDSAPLAPDYNFIATGEENAFQTGIDALSKLTDGKLHVNLRADTPPSKVFSQAKNVQINRFKGPHPAGSPGIQIHHIDPVCKGDIVWYLNALDVITIGKLFETGKFDPVRTIALTGPEVKEPKYYKVRTGENIQHIIEDNIKEGKVRYISGNVLSGKQITKDGFLGFYDYQITVIPEGDQPELFGWASPGFDKFSVARTFFTWLQPKRKWRISSNTHGGERPFVITGEYDKVLPMNILPVHLLKAIIIEDIDLMEQLGIYEVAEEDFALCEFVCTSKIEVQSIIRKGINVMIREFS